MTEAARITLLAQRIATEFKTLRTQMGTARAVKLTKSQYAQLTNKDNTTMYLISDWGTNSPFAADTFARPDSTTAIGKPSTGLYAWSTYASTWGLIGGAAYQPSAAANGIAYEDIQVVEHYVEGRIVTADTGSMIVGRMTDQNNYTGIGLYADGTRSIWRSVGGTLSQISLASGDISAIAANDLLRLSFKGNLCTVFQNGTAIATFNDTTQGTKNGFRCNTASARFKDYKTDIT